MAKEKRRGEEVKLRKREDVDKTIDYLWGFVTGLVILVIILIIMTIKLSINLNSPINSDRVLFKGDGSVRNTISLETHIDYKIFELRKEINRLQFRINEPELREACEKYQKIFMPNFKVDTILTHSCNLDHEDEFKFIRHSEIRMKLDVFNKIHEMKKLRGEK